MSSERHPADDFTRDIPPEVLSMGDRARRRIDELLGGAPVTLVSVAYRRGRDDAAGGAPDMSEATLRLTAKAVHDARPGVSVPSAYAVIQSLLVLGWRPPPGPAKTGIVHLIEDGRATTTCCGRAPFELAAGAGHRLTVEASAATCQRVTSPAQRAEATPAGTTNGETT